MWGGRSGGGAPAPPSRLESLGAGAMSQAGAAFFRSSNGQPSPARQVAAVAPLLASKAVTLARENPEAAKAVAGVGVAALRAQMEAEAQKGPAKAPKPRLATERPRPQPRSSALGGPLKPPPTSHSRPPQPLSNSAALASAFSSPPKPRQVPSSNKSSNVALLTSQLGNQLTLNSTASHQTSTWTGSFNSSSNPQTGTQRKSWGGQAVAPPRPPPPKAVAGRRNSAKSGTDEPGKSWTRQSGSGGTAQGSCQVRGPRAEALFDFCTGELGDLSFRKGQTIGLVARLNQDWLRGHIEGREGAFPANYVRVVEDLPSAQPPQPQPPAPGEGDERRALATFVGEEAGDLSFSEGDWVGWEGLVGRGSEWARGRTRDGRSGVFPASFVSRLAEAEWDYESGEPADLRFRQGQRIQVDAQEGPDWLSGRLQGSNLPPKLFPASFVRFL